MPRKKEASSNETAAAALAQADKAIAEARANLAEIRHQQRASTIESRDLEERVQAELVAAGRDGREPAHVPEWRARIAELDQARHDLEAQERGSTIAVTTAEGARSQAMLLHYPELAVELDQAEAGLVERRERIEAEQSRLAADEAQHRSAWTALVSVVPGFEQGSSFVPLEAQGIQFSAGAAPTPLLHPARRPEHADGALLGLVPAESWPMWLRRAWEDTKRPDPNQQPTPAMVIDAARFDDADDTPPAPASGEQEFGELLQRARATDRDADANQVRL